MIKRTFSKAFWIVVILVLILYLLSIFAINIFGRVYVDYDMYSDAIVSKYMASQRSVFPDGWHFGNQVYIVATPVVASLFYFIVEDSYFALALASCFMTVLCLLSFGWCIKPFGKAKHILLALFVLIGGTNISLTAHADMEGLQLFYTMASYYSCYIIGIFLTLGVYFRYLQGRKVSVFILCSVLLLNFALGVQSLREMLVLNLPLLAVAFLETLYQIRYNKTTVDHCKRGAHFASAALLANLGGIALYKVLSASQIILQDDIITSASAQAANPIIASIRAFLTYIGFVSPASTFQVFQCLGAIFSLAITVTSLVLVLIDYRKHQTTILGCSILFFSISLIAVFLSGVFLIALRPVYYFCWYLLVAVCVLYLLEYKCEKFRKLAGYLKNLLVVGLLCVSLINYVFTFVISFQSLNETTLFYQKIVDQLTADGIEYVYTDYHSEQSMLATLSRDDIVYAPLYFSDDPEDLWKDPNFLYMDFWFDEDHSDHAYILLNSHSLQMLNENYTAQYRDSFLSNLELVHEFVGKKTTVYLYKGSEKMFNDIRE